MDKDHKGGGQMTLVWKHLRPMDTYTVRLTNALSLFQLKTVAQLYQPVIGSLAYALYMTFLSETEGDEHISPPNNHQWLMNVMSIHLDQIYHSRLRLEAIGLLKTFRVSNRAEGEDLVAFDYHLLPPLNPEQYFADDVLSICLYNQIGARRYRQLRSRYSTYFTDSGEPTDVEKEEITQEFHEVFSSLHSSELMARKGTEMQRELQESKEMFPISQGWDKEGTAPGFSRFELDLDTLKSFFMKGLDPDEILSHQYIPELKKVAFFYQMDEYELSRLIQDSLTLDDQLDVSRLKTNAKEWYRFQHGGKPPQVIQQSQPPQERVMQEEELQTEEERHLYKLEILSPLQLLEAYQGGGRVAEADIKLVEELLFDYQLAPGVVNLLVEYILLTNEFKLPKNLVTKVAAHWRRLKIGDVRQAQELAKKEHRQYKEWKEKKGQAEQGKATSSPKHSRRSGPGRGREGHVRRDTLPKWIQSGEEQQDGGTSSLSDQQKRERMKALLKALGETDE